MKAIRLKLTTTPRVYFSNGVLQTIELNSKAYEVAIKAIGLIVMKQNGGTNIFSDDKKTIVGYYDKKERYLFFQTTQEAKNGLNLNITAPKK